MQYDNLVDSMAAFSKFAIEVNGQAGYYEQVRGNKELEKAKVDFLASVLKAIDPFPRQNLNPLDIGINFEWIRQVKQIAPQYSVEKVILFPYIDANGNLFCGIRVYGGNVNQFIEAIGMRPLVDDNMQEVCAIMSQWESAYGIIIYESSE